MAKVFTITEGLENLGALKTGGQGSVYKGRRVGEIITAIKLLPTPIYSESADDKNFTAFQNEVQKLKKVNEEPDPNVVKILSYGITDSGNFPYIEMEFIEGPDLEELLKPPHDPVFSVREVLKVAEHLSSALAHCHKLGIRHGDIKSNNVKYNAATGNYVLLDFGLSVMSDEQRRTSIRHAGAVEFMAPEQNEGEMLFQTDIYSFGVILFELLAGRVPFPLNNKGETARNTVMLAHLETLPPDILSLRQQALPAGWSEQKKKEEMQVPVWLTGMIYKCLEKRPKDRFENGVDLHKFIWEHRLQAGSFSTSNNDTNSFLEQENKRLRRENEQLHQQLMFYKRTTAVPGSAGSEEPDNISEVDKRKLSSESRTIHAGTRKKKIMWAFVVLIILAGTVYLYIKNEDKFAVTQQRETIGEYKVVAARAYIYKAPDENSRTNYYAARVNDQIEAFKESDGFFYCEIKNLQGSKKGWLRKRDLIKSDEWAEKNRSADFSDPSKRRVLEQLDNARNFLSDGKRVEALIIYNSLAKQEVPEAMYLYGKLALQSVNFNITCAEAFNLIKQAADKGYIPAKRTLGFLYSFAEDKNILQQNRYYQRCKFTQNLKKGAKLLMEATLGGDTTASRLIDNLNGKQAK